MENKIEYKILDDKVIVYFYGELSCSNVVKYRSLLNSILIFYILILLIVQALD